MNAATYNRQIVKPKTSGRAAPGFALVELVLTIAVIAILAAFTVTSFGDSSEVRDAALVQSAQAALQSIVAQGSARMAMTPATLRDSYSGSVLNALKASFNTTGTTYTSVQFTPSGNDFIMTIPSSGRSATYSISTSGDVTLSGLSNFTTYEKLNGVIGKI
jgi:prepilin-type N-terminal cleavage/methylation domain-containing protein